MTPKKYQQILQEKVTKTYKKSPQKLEFAINLEAKNIAESWNNDDRVESLAKAEAFISPWKITTTTFVHIQHVVYLIRAKVNLEE